MIDPGRRLNQRGPADPIGALQPQRLPGLADRVWRFVARRTSDIGPQSEEKATTQSGHVQKSGLGDAFNEYFNYDISRQQIYADVMELDRQSEEFHTALNVIANNTNASEDGEQETFSVVCQQANARRILEDLFDRVKIIDMMQAWTRSTLKMGDSFAEVVVNRNMEISRVRLLPATRMNRNEDKYGVLKLTPPKYDPNGHVINQPGQCAFEETAEDNTKLVATFFPWQIIHLRWNWDGESQYGQSMGIVARLTWRKLKALEESLVVGRLTRAFLKFIFHVDTTGLPRAKKEEVIDEFTREIQEKQTPADRRRVPWSVFSDLVLSSGWLQVGTEVKEQRTRVDVVDPRNQALTDIQDIKYVHRKLVSQLYVPPAHTGWEEDVNSKATLTHQDVQYVRILRQVQRLMGRGVRQLGDIQLILKGFDPKKVKWDAHWPELSAADDAAAADAENKRAQSDAIYFEMETIDREFMQRHRFGMDDQDINRVKKFFADLSMQKQQQAADAAEQDAQTQIKVAQATKPAPNGTPGSSPGATNGNVPSLPKNFQKAAVGSSAGAQQEMEELETWREFITELGFEPRPEGGVTLVQAPAPAAPPQQLHLHVHEGAIKHESHHDIHVDGPAPVPAPEVHLDAGSIQIDHHEHVSVEVPERQVNVGSPTVEHHAAPAPVNMKVNIGPHSHPPHGARVIRDKKGLVIGAEPTDGNVLKEDK